MAALLTAGCGGMFGFGKKAALYEWKDIARLEVPKHLEKPMDERTERALRLEFRRYYPWWDFSAMGSFTPIREVLALEVLPAATRPQADTDWTASEARSYVKGNGWHSLSWAEEQAGVKEVPLTLTREGPLQYGEGIYTINMLRDKVVVVLLDVPEKNLSIGYRAWRRDVSVEEAIRRVQAVASSLVLTGTIEQIFGREQTRPAREYQERLERASAQLKAYGLQLPEPDAITSKERTFAERRGKGEDEELTVVAVLADLPRPPTSSQDWSYGWTSLNHPSYLQAVGWYLYQEGQWQYDSSNGDRGHSPELARRLMAGVDPGRILFVATTRVDLKTDPVERVQLDWFLTRLPETVKRLQDGRLVRFTNGNR